MVDDALSSRVPRVAMNALLALWLAFAPNALAARREAPPNVSELKLPEVESQTFVFGPGDKFSVKVFKQHGIHQAIINNRVGTF